LLKNEKNYWKKKSPLSQTGKMQLSIEETRDLVLPYAEHLLPHAEHPEHAPLRWKTFDTFHPWGKGYSIHGKGVFHPMGLP
jgi:hypothetical protein